MTGWPALAGLAAGAAVALALHPVPGRAGLSGARRSWWVALPVVAFGLATAGSVLPALVLGVAALGALGIRVLLDQHRQRTEATLTSRWVLETCELLGSELAAGQSPLIALQRAAEEWEVLRPVAEAGGLAGDPAAVLVELSRSPGASELRLVAAAWTVAHRSGSGLSDVLDRVADTLRERRATRRVVESELASARATARLVAALPVVMLLLGGGHGSGAWTFLLGHPAGLACLAAGVTLGLLGLWWIERIAAGVLR